MLEEQVGVCFLCPLFFSLLACHTLQMIHNHSVHTTRFDVGWFHSISSKQEPIHPYNLVELRFYFMVLFPALNLVCAHILVSLHTCRNCTGYADFKVDTRIDTRYIHTCEHTHTHTNSYSRCMRGQRKWSNDRRALGETVVSSQLPLLSWRKRTEKSSAMCITA